MASFQDSRSGFNARDLSPDSEIFTAESSNFSLFSSASASVERCSFASDVPDQDSVSSLVSRHLAGHELSEVLSGPDPDSNKPTSVHKNSINLSRKPKTKVQKVDSSEAETTEDENIAIGSARNSFSQALKDCQDRRLRSEILLKKSDRRRPASLDLNNPVNNTVNTSSSPRLLTMNSNKQSFASRKTSGVTFPSPGTPNYRQANVGGIQKGWSSERVPLHSNASRRNLNTPPLLPHNNYGRTTTLPSKWEDAERWIFSPVSGDGALRTSTQQAQRRPKSKSGPLGPPGVAYYQMFSPAGQMFDVGGQNGKLMANSPFFAGVMNVDGLSGRYRGCEGGGSGNFQVGPEPCMARSVSMHGCSEMLSQSSLPLHHELQNVNSKRTEIRDVPVDERVTMTRWSKKNKGKSSGRGSRSTDDWKRKAVNFQSSSWEISTETTKTVSNDSKGGSQNHCLGKPTESKSRSCNKKTRDEIGKEEVVVHGQNNEQTEIRTKEGPRNEKLRADQSVLRPSNRETLRSSIVLPKDSAHWLVEWMLHVSCLLVYLSCYGLQYAYIHEIVKMYEARLLQTDKWRMKLIQSCIAQNTDIVENLF
ncbi:hypothetical protein CASFOL_021268 [Castilleja foliolosa]|uniref:Uncharacterized protein n=1 Tax=Castilleja foliolosa TaxID=1961234 RepID=A0ABD3CXA6_9LAMI